MKQQLPWNYNIHSHTARCGHAEGTDEEYVQAAIRAGFSYLGFSDHVFLPGIEQPGIRGNFELLDEYIASVRGLAEKYRDQITIYLGFEAEYFEPFLPYYKELLASKKIDYLIQGQHYDYVDGALQWYSKAGTNEEAVKRYTDDVVKGIESGLFTYIAHPDFFMIFEPIWLPYHAEAARRICLAAKKKGIPLEVNMAKSRYDPPHFDPVEWMCYPYPAFWKIAGEIGVDVVIGVDAHRPYEYDKANYQFFSTFVAKHHLKLIQHCPLDKE